MKRMTRKEFEAWFREQHGPRPKGKRHELFRKAVEGNDANQTMILQDRWDAQYKTACYMFTMVEEG